MRRGDRAPGPPGRRRDHVRPTLGISTCLLGEKVRYDGAAKQDPFLTDTFGRFVDWVPVCPEVECGLPVPREPMRLEGDPDTPRMVTRVTRTDHTGRMRRWMGSRLRDLEGEGLDGYVFKTKSPSCGMRKVPIYQEGGAPRRAGVGLWARALTDRFTLVPAEDDVRLRDPDIRENFIERVFCLRRYRNATAGRRGRGALVAFHSAHKLQLMAHGPAVLREMGRLVASAGELRPSELYGEYERLLVKAMRLRATPGKNANVLMHALGYFKRDLSADEKREALEVIESHRRGRVPLVVPVTLVRHYARLHEVSYLVDQSYVRPDPVELMLRNHA